MRPEGVWTRHAPRGAALAALGLGALVLFQFREAVFQGRAFYERDVHLVFQPQAESFVATVASGSWPLWDRRVAFGQPLLADPAAQVLYPFTWLNLLLRPWTFYTVLVVSHVAFGAVGFHLLALRLGLPPSGAFAGTVVWVLSGPQLSLVNLFHHLTGAAWIPWVLLAAERAWDEATARRILAWSATAAFQIVAGSADMCLVSAALAGFRLVARTEWREPLGAAARRRAAAAAAALGGALALSAALWIPAWELASRAARRELPADVRSHWSVHPARGVELVWPLLWNDLPLRPEERRALFEGREPFFFSIYLGVPALALAGAGVARGRKGARGWLVLAALALLLAMGRHGVLYPLATDLVPALRVFRYPEKAMVLAAFCWAMLAGLGATAWRSAGPTGRLWIPLVVAPPVVVAVASGLAALWGPGLGLPWLDRLQPQADRIALAGAAALAAAVLALARAARPAAGPRLGAALIALTALDLTVASRGTNPTADPELYTQRPEAVDVLRRESPQRVHVFEYFHTEGKSREYLGRSDPYRIGRIVKDWPFRASASLALRAYLVPPVLGAWGFESSYEPDLRGLFPDSVTDLTRLVRTVEETPGHVRLLRMGAVSHVLALHTRGLEDLTPVTAIDGFFVDPIRVFRVPDPLPLAYAVSGARIADGRRALEELLQPSFEPAREVVLPEGPPRAPQAGFVGTGRLLEVRPDRVRLQARLSHPGWVVLVDAYDPGWHVTVDGRTARVLRANVAFRAVQVGAGPHEIEYVYRPRSVTAGLLVSGAALASLFAAVFVFPLLTRRDARGTSPP